MTVKELINNLREMPENSIVLWGGSEYTPVNNVCRGVNELDGAVILGCYEEE